MREEFTSYATGDVELFQDFLERSDILEQDKIAMLEAIAKNGWDECLEVWLGREEPLLETRDGQQAWVTMAGEGHTDCWMQMAALALRAQDTAAWKNALDVCKEEAIYVKA